MDLRKRALNHPKWQSLAIDAIGPLAWAVPLGMVVRAISFQGYLSDLHAGLLTKVLLALDRGRFEVVGFSYPPLPLFLLLFWPSPHAPISFGTVFVAVTVYLVFNYLHERKHLFALAGLAALLLSPVMVVLVLEDFPHTVGILLLWSAWRQYLRWMDEQVTAYIFFTGLLLGIAVYATPFALPLALLFAAGLGFVRRLPLDVWLAGGLVLVFPSLAGFTAWAYLSWLFNGKPVFLYSSYWGQAPPLGQILVAAPMYIATGFMWLGRAP